MAKATVKTPYNAVYRSPYGEVLTFTHKAGEILYFRKEYGGVSYEGGAMTQKDLENLVSFNRLTKQ